MKRLPAIVCCLLLLAGCADMSMEAPASKSQSRRVVDDSYSTLNTTALALDDSASMQTRAAEAAGEDSPTGAAIDAAPAQRKIIYTAQIHLVVDSMDVAETSIKKLIDQQHGYIDSFSENGASGDRRSAQWVVRVPVGGFNDVLDAVADLGVPENRSINSEDVSEQFVDLQARLKNQRRLEDELAQLLEKHDGELKDIIAVKHELSSVREVIEQIEGKLRFLSNRVDLTTITIYAREDRDYEPPQAATFATRITDTWDRSLTSLQATGENLVIAAVGFAPWLAVLAMIMALPALLLWRRLRAVRSPGRSL